MGHFGLRCRAANSMTVKFDDLESVLHRVSETADFSNFLAQSVISRGFFGTTPLHVVAVWGNIEVPEIKELLKIPIAKTD